MKRVQIITLGCKVNQFESAAFATGFQQAGARLVDRDEDCDLIVVNSCAVTASAGAQSRRLIRQALRRNPRADLVVTGCYAEIGAEELAADPEIAEHAIGFIGNSTKDQLVATALAGRKSTTVDLLGDIGGAREITRLEVSRFAGRSRAYLRIQDGCDSYCTYCIVPYTRGPSRSLPPAEVIEQAIIFAAAGHREIVLTGIHLGYYGKDLGDGFSLTRLLESLIAATPDTYYRISSLEPTEITRELLELMAAAPTIQPHLHIPLQSGSDTILRRMNRNYTTADFREVIETCHRFLPDIGVGIDVLVGFPGETDELFAECRRFLTDLDYSYLHVFPYSIRPGTPAASYRGQVPKDVKESRVAILRQVSRDKTISFARRQLGRRLRVLVEGRRDSQGRLKGYTGNYVTVSFDGDDTLFNSIATVRLERVEAETVVGILEPPAQH